MLAFARRALLRFSLAFAFAACATQAESPPSIPVDPDRELLVTDWATLSVLGDSTTAAPLSFRAALEALDGPERAPELARAWLRDTSARLRAEGTPDRATKLDEVTCAWRRATPSNACDVDCVACARDHLDLSRAPFRLAAVVNRLDLATQPDRVGEAGEGRLVFELTSGLDARPFAIIFEYAQRGAAREWATRWHALRDVSEGTFAGALSELVGEGLVARGATTLARVRTADGVTGPLRMDERTFDRNARALVAVPLRNTVDWARVPEAEVRDFLLREGDALARGTALFPPSWWASSVTETGAAPPRWLTSARNGDLLRDATCTGCHARTREGFQIEPGRYGRARLSTLLADDSRDGEMHRRTVFLQLNLSGAGRDD